MHVVFLVLSKALSSLNAHCGQYGCCADSKTPSPDPAMAGCPENLHQETKNTENKIKLHKKAKKQKTKNVPCFEVVCGCCPDGVSIAMGPNYQGCGIQRPLVPKGSCFFIRFRPQKMLTLFHSIIFKSVYFI